MGSFSDSRSGSSRPEVRKAERSDAPHIAHLIRVLGYALDVEEVPGRLLAYTNPTSRVFVALVENVVVGFVSVQANALFHQVSRIGRITAMAIDPGCQRRGI